MTIPKGHVPVQPLEGDKFEGYSWGGKSPFRGRRTVEGITSSVALTERLEQITGEKNLPRSRLVELDDNHEVWDHSANALANLCATLLLTTSVEKIVLGGGIMNRKGLIEKIGRKTVVLLNGYLELPKDISGLICKSSYGNDVGLTGALVLAQSAYDESLENPKTPGSSEFGVGFVHGVIAGAGAALAVVAIFSQRKK
jgi:fructokinase